MRIACQGCCLSLPTAAATPMRAPPRNETRVPRVEMAPDVPTGAGRPLVIRRGGRWLSVPNSVAQVSALAVAVAPRKKGNQAEEGDSWLRRAAVAPAPPLANA